MVDTTAATYVAFGVLSLLLLLFLTNAMTHFLFHHECPFLRRDVEVDGIYPTLLMLYIAVSAAMCALMLQDFSSPSNIDCSLTHSSIDSLYLSCVTWLFVALLMLEIYIALTRWFNVVNGGSHHSHKSMNSLFALYCFVLLVLSWISLTALPLLVLALASLHTLSTALFSFAFYRAIYASYSRYGLDKIDEHVFGDMQRQIRLIRIVALSSSFTSALSALSWCSLVLCSASFAPWIPCVVGLNCLLSHAMFTKNRLFLQYILLGRVHLVCAAIKAPCSLIHLRRSHHVQVQQISP